MSKLIFRLMSRHQQIDTALRREQARRLPDFVRLQRLKKLKLAIKDRLAALTMGRRIAPQR
ncbi:MAG: YdcH family protein [Sphingobium sp.]|nr:YdcH family protein [Sphingobium sp.]